ncbi:MAG: formate/nitrite transporter family protein, partial [Oscillospiraceae bacterium]|nr:formate/nitrite transporter family protein [Oscillospiraceae bacterium]
MQSTSAVSILGKAVVAGLLIGIGGTVYLLCENKYLGGFLFSFGLFCIIRYGFALYTGKVGYIPDNKPAYLCEVVLTFLGNLAGTGLAAILIRLTRVGSAVQANAAVSMAVKTGDTHISRLILGFFCGILMYLAVDNGKKCTSDKLDTALVFGTAVPVMVFIFCGFNHSVADCFYFFASLTAPSELLSGLVYLLEVMLGNALGGMC